MLVLWLTSRELADNYWLLNVLLAFLSVGVSLFFCFCCIILFACDQISNAAAPSTFFPFVTWSAMQPNVRRRARTRSREPLVNPRVWIAASEVMDAMNGLDAQQHRWLRAFFHDKTAPDTADTPRQHSATQPRTTTTLTDDFDAVDTPLTTCS